MEEAYKKAIAYLSKREHSRLELEKKLKERGFSDADIEQTLTRLTAENVVNDDTYADNFVRLRKAAGYGPERIIYELEHRGISKEIIREKVNPHSPDWIRQMMTLLNRRFPDNDTDNRVEKFRFLANRGYNSEEIRRCVNRVKSNDND